MIPYSTGSCLTAGNVFLSYRQKSIKYFCMGELAIILVRVIFLIIKVDHVYINYIIFRCYSR